MNTAPSSPSSSSSVGHVFPSGRFDLTKTLSPVLHHAANAIIIAAAIPTRFSRLSKRVAWAARGTWAAWSAISTRDIQVEHRRRLEGLLKHDNFVSALGKLDKSLMEVGVGDITNVNATTERWARSRHIDRLKLRKTRAEEDFEEAALTHYRQRIDQHFSSSAICVKSLLGFVTLGMLPNTLFVLNQDVARYLDNVLFGQLPACSNGEATAEAVMDGVEYISWYRGVFDGEDERSGIDPMMVFDRTGKSPLFEDFPSSIATLTSHYNWGLSSPSRGSFSVCLDSPMARHFRLKVNVHSKAQR
mmetsp:Transcript_19679/g.37896  ORF Transcript_19679/g.37896 Transcript_19679/m.37896 type:complete len:302 (-) Transcript_19679:44-949(-)|eukprot:CAMPEP_0167789962 /NCGR_PEP_ID=MMETSP0111_2-20121227/11017_1 /TAXON_ID=91324 /ORGANISM="Lotharella globosa, Strain CCCM811" /LENGTH=301 /DNA_ID=CAMNT_0007682269 /DNA_START=106 /DNA_END=1011 /DNA_ORIENTATION=-